MGDFANRVVKMTTADLALVLILALKHVNKSDIWRLRLVSWRICNEADDLVWETLEVWADCADPLICNTLYTFYAPEDGEMKRIFKLIEQNALRIKRVTIVWLWLQSLHIVTDTFSRLKMAKNIEKITIEISGNCLDTNVTDCANRREFDRMYSPSWESDEWWRRRIPVINNKSDHIILSGLRRMVRRLRKITFKVMLRSGAQRESPLLLIKDGNKTVRITSNLGLLWRMVEPLRLRKIPFEVVLGSGFSRVSPLHVFNAIYPYPDELLTVSSPSSLGLMSLIHRDIAVYYGERMTSLRCMLENEGDILYLIDFVQFCNHLDTLGTGFFGQFPLTSYEYPIESRTLVAPPSLKNFELSEYQHSTGEMAFIFQDINRFEVDCMFPRFVSLKFHSIKELSITNSTKVTNDLLNMLAKMGMWETLKIDTVDLNCVRYFESVVAKTSKSLDLYESWPGMFEPRPGYLQECAQWFKDMGPSISQLQYLTLRIPFLAPEELKKFVVETIWPVMPNLKGLYFRQGPEKSGESEYTFLSPRGSSADYRYFLSRKSLDKVRDELMRDAENPFE